MSGKRIYLSPPWFGDREKSWLDKAIASGYIAPCGPMVDEFERRLASLAGVPSAAAVASGTAALDLLMAELGVERGDTVIASDLTFIATVGPAVHRGAKCVFVDSDPLTGTVSIPLLREALSSVSSKPKCVIVADIYGQCCDYDALETLCAEFSVPLVVDAAESVGASWNGRPAGSAGIAGVYSFNGNKIITTSGGGAVLSRDAGIVNRARWRSQQSREKAVWYEHCEVGYNYRMSNLLGAAGIGQLEMLDEIVSRKRKIFNVYRKALEGIAEPYPCDSRAFSTRWLSVFLFNEAKQRDAVVARLDGLDVETRPIWKPMHLQPVFKDASVFGGSVSADFFKRGLCLPSGAGLDESQLDMIVSSFGG